MHGADSFREFCHRFGYIPFSEVVQEALARLLVFLLLYVPFLFIVLPASFVARSLGIYKIVVAVLVFLSFLGLLRDRKLFVAELGELIGILKQDPGRIIEFFVVEIIGTLTSLLWLPFWLVFGMLLSVVFITEFFMKSDQLGREYSEKLGASRA